MTSIKLVCFIVFAAFLPEITAQNTQSRSECRQVLRANRTGNDNLQICPFAATSEPECNVDFCCYNAEAMIPCYLNTRKGSLSIDKARAMATLAANPVARPNNANALRNLARNPPNSLNIDEETGSSIEGRALSNGNNLLQVALASSFPECAVRTPICYRTRCNAQIRDAETNPLTCLSDPSCCFDEDLFVYKFIFGSNFMAGAPVCYYGPTSPRYREIARLLGNAYNPFFQPVIVSIFEEYFDTALNFQDQLTCRLTNLQTSSNIAIRGPYCGWQGIRKLECHLKGCCFNERLNYCAYPSAQVINAVGGNVNVYPEFDSKFPGDDTCTPTQALTPETFKRLPCRADSSLSSTATCPRDTCCTNVLALVVNNGPISRLFNGNFGALTGLFGNNNVFSGLGIQSALQGSGVPASLLTAANIQAVQNAIQSGDLTRIFCPFNPIDLLDFPPLNVDGCCTQHSCYHLANPTGPPINNCQWSEWSSIQPCNAFGQQQRARTCRNAFDGNQCSTCPGSGTDSVPCTVVLPCSTATWNTWIALGVCNAPCNSFGQQTRTRSCIDSTGQNCNNCPGQPTQIIGCDGPPCPGFWTAWSFWSNCLAGCDQTGTISRTRSCRRSDNQITTGCPGGGSEQQSCRGPTCCNWTNWSPSGTCNAACGSSGQQRRTRRCITSRGQSCNSCLGSSTLFSNCFGPPCYSYRPWTSYSHCSNSCTRERYRYCYSASSPIENSLCSSLGPSEEIISCTGDACLPVINTPWVTWGNWFGWSSCSLGCGTGTRFRSRICLLRGNPANPLPISFCSNSGLSGDTREELTCNSFQCNTVGPRNLPEWSEWSTCTQSCGTGTQSRTRNCDSTVNNNEDCSEERDCNTQNCSTDGSSICYGPYTSWSTCSCTSEGMGKKRRVRCPCQSSGIPCTQNTADFDSENCSC